MRHYFHYAIKALATQKCRYEGFTPHSGLEKSLLHVYALARLARSARCYAITVLDALHRDPDITLVIRL
jgi:hypothetical protein